MTLEVLVMNVLRGGVVFRLGSFATLECELLDRRISRTHGEARSAVFDFIESFYNRHWRDSALGYLSPEEHERRSTPTTPIVA